MANIAKDVKNSTREENFDFRIVATDINNIFENEKVKMIVSEEGVKIDVLSTELTENKVIKVEPDTVRNLELRRKQPQFNEKLVNYEKRKQNIDDIEIG